MRGQAFVPGFAPWEPIRCKNERTRRRILCTTLAVPKEFVDLSTRLADAARDAIRPYFRTVGGTTFDAKSDESPVTAADRAAEAAMREILQGEQPDHAIVGEEFGVKDASSSSEFTWVLDPIDGTKAFMTGKPTFGTLIALMHGTQVVLGIIDQPISGERWMGVHGEGTSLNGRSVSIQEHIPEKLSDANLHATHPDMFTGIERMAFEELSAACRYTLYGSDCYAYALLAMGHTHIVCESDMKPWDYMALVPVIKEAGGVITDWRGAELGLESNGTVLAAVSPQLHREALDLLQQAPKGLLLLREQEDRVGTDHDFKDISDSFPAELPTSVGASSMTGFGSYAETKDGVTVKVEMRSINSRYFDCTIKSPRALQSYEREFTSFLRSELQRGKVLASIEVKEKEMSVLPIKVDKEAVQAARSLIDQVRTVAAVDGELSIDHILRFSEVFVKKDSLTLTKELLPFIEEVLKKAVSDLRDSRRREGYVLQLDLLRRCKNIKDVCDEISSRLPKILAREKEHTAKLSKEIADNTYLEGRLIPANVADYLMPSRVDVSEELVRLKSHLSIFQISFFSNKQIGQKLTFLIQEMNREVTTISAKVNDAPICQMCVLIREQLERMREQVQNVV